MGVYARLMTGVLQVLAILVLALSAPLRAAPAIGPSSAPAMPTHIAPALLAEGPVAPGGTVTLAIAMRPEKGWHGYWKNPGDAGFGMTLRWTLPSGYQASDPLYPVPHTLVIAGLMNHVYEQDYALLVHLKVPETAVPGSRVPLSLEAEWLACTDQICVPERAKLGTVVAIAAAGAATPPHPRFDGWRARLPAPLGSAARMAVEPGRIRLAIPLPRSLPIEDPHLFPGQDRVVAYAAPQEFRRKDDLLLVTLARPATNPAAPATFSGLLRLNRAGDGVEIEAVPGAVPTGGEPIGPTGGAPANLLLLLLAALAGGLILNVMPCVFPILSLKALSLARAGESEAEARREGLAYTAGVILACLILGGLLLALRAAGSEIGWAFQLQEPGVVAALLLVAVAITANLAGLYEFAVPGFARAGSPQGAFATGLLAAFVATPCTGPFMAAAMGAALLLPAPQALALFAALGLGLALPFLALALVPALRRRLPRPGRWMNTFRHLLAVPMGLTALALGWLAWRLGGAQFAAIAVALAVALVALLVWAGRTQRRGRSAKTGTAAGLALLAAIAVVALPGAARSPGSAEAGILDAKPFSEAALATARTSGKPVFVYFTADWCLTCKVNEEIAIERAATRDAFRKAGVIVLRGDWTRRDPAITRYLTRRGAAGVPLYDWYAPGQPPETLPQVLSADLLAALAAKSG